MMTIKELRTSFSLFILVVLGGCTSNSDMTVGDNIPAGAEIVEYYDSPGLVHVMMKDGDQITAEGDFLNGLEHGAWTEYDSKGLVTRITNYFQGKKQGITINFKNNQVESKAIYHNDELNGDYKKYDRKKIVEAKTYLDGKLNGVVRKYYSTNGNIMEEATYDNGKLNGIAKWYNQEGEMTIAYEYDNGELINKNPELK